MSRSHGIRYAGAKGKCGGMVTAIQNIIDSIDNLDTPDGWPLVFAPFCGSCKVEDRLKRCVLMCSDIDEPIITLLTAVQNGWSPPLEVSETEYKFWMNHRTDMVNPMMGFVGYGCSFGARYFQGYARSKKGSVNFAKSARIALLKQKPYLKNASFVCGDYQQIYWELFRESKPDLIFCDPPYAGTKPVGSNFKPFDSKRFWKWAVRRANEGIIVLVCEYSCPIKSAQIIWEEKIAAGIRFGTKGDGGHKGSGKRKRERLYCLNPKIGNSIGLGVL